MPELQPLRDIVLIEPILRTEVRKEHIKSKIPGFEVAGKPEGGEGVPTIGRVHAVGPEAPAELKPGMRVAFNEQRPHGFQWEGTKGIIPIKADQVVGVLEEQNV